MENQLYDLETVLEKAKVNKKTGNLDWKEEIYMIHNEDGEIHIWNEKEDRDMFNLTVSDIKSKHFYIKKEINEK